MLLRLIALVLPALIPSWRFFQSVGPSPRIEFRLINDGLPSEWREDSPRPATLGPGAMVKRLFWNPEWNRKLYLVSLSERLIAENTDHSTNEINSLLARGLVEQPGVDLQFRLVFVMREGEETVRAVVHESQPVSLGEVS